MIRNDSGQKAREQDEARVQIAFLHQKLGTEQGSYDNEKISLEFDDTGGFTPVNILVIDNRVVRIDRLECIEGPIINPIVKSVSVTPIYYWLNCQVWMIARTPQNFRKFVRIESKITRGEVQYLGACHP